MAYSYGFEKLAVWQMSRQFAKNLYLHTKSFPKEEQFGITAQLRRAAVSIACNLAEGSARFSSRDKSRFYQIAYGSAVEVVNLLIISTDLELLPEDAHTSLRREIENLTYHINQLVQNLNNGVQEPDVIYGDPFRSAGFE